MLTKLLIANTKPDTKPRRLSDGRGMYLEIAPAGGRWWRFKYRLDGRERRISLGVYPEVGLAEARERREQARKQVASGIDPGQQRRAEKVALAERAEDTFTAIAHEWVEMFSPKWVATHSSKVEGRLEKDLLPWLGDRAIRDITAPEVLSVLRRIASRGADETARRASVSSVEDHPISSVGDHPRGAFGSVRRAPRVRQWLDFR